MLEVHIQQESMQEKLVVLLVVQLGTHQPQLLEQLIKVWLVVEVMLELKLKEQVVVVVVQEKLVFKVMQIMVVMVVMV